MSVFFILLCLLLKFSKHDLLLSHASVLCPFLHAAGPVQGRVELRCNCMVLACFCILFSCISVSSHPCILSPMLRQEPGVSAASPCPLPAVSGSAGSAVEPHKQQSSSVINIQQTEQVLGRLGCSEGAHESGGLSVCFSFHLSALIFRALQFGQTNISRVHGESMQCSVQDIIHLSPLSATSLQTDINKSFIVLHHHNALKLRKEEKKIIREDNLFSKCYPFVSCSQGSSDICH